MCAYLAAMAVACDEELDERERVRRLLNLAGVCRAWYECIFSVFVLPDISLSGTWQLQSFHWSLEKNVSIRRLTAVKTKRVHVLQHSRRRRQGNNVENDTSNRQRASLYDFLSNLTDFEKVAKPYVRAVLSRTAALTELHLEMTPDVLRGTSMKSGKGTHDVRQSLRSLSFLLTTFGGVGCEDLFVGLTKQPTTATKPPGPWENLTHLQISGPAGFRLSMSTSSSIGSLPSLTHLSLVMPNIVRDASMNRAMNTTPPAALQLLVLLLADQLEEFIVVGHTLSGYMGWSGNYEGWLSGLQLPFAARERRRVVSRMRVMLVVASCEDVTAHPNCFTSWMIARAREGSQWEWEQPTKADGEHAVTWDVRDWLVPYAPRDDEEADEAMVTSPSATPTTSGQMSQSAMSATHTPSSLHTNSPSCILGLDDLD